MRSLAGTIIAAVASVSLVTAGLWAWQQGAERVADWPAARPEALVAAVRCLAVAAVAMGQVLALCGVAARIYPRRAGDDLLRLLSAVTCVIALVSAAALGLAGR